MAHFENEHLKPQMLAVKEKYAETMMHQCHLNGIGVGVKSVNGHFINKLAVVMTVEKKLPLDQIPTGWLIPKTLDGMDVDVLETGKAELVAFTGWIRPAEPGYSVGPTATSTGTFGCVVYKGATRYILSNNHILANVNSGSVGDLIYQPGPLDLAPVPDNVIANLSQWVPLANGVKVDCAIAQIAVPTSHNLVTDTGQWGGSIDNYTDPVLFNWIIKTGRTTETTTSQLLLENFDLTLNYGGSVGSITVKNGFATYDPLGGIADLGDSGSIGRLNNNTAVGLLFARGNQVSPPITGTFGFFNYIFNVVKALELDLAYIGTRAKTITGVSSMTGVSTLT